MRIRLIVLTLSIAAVAANARAQTLPATTAPHGDFPAKTFPPGVPPPVIQDKFTADPDAHVFGDTFYIYPTVDKDQWMTTEFNVWSSKDLIHWNDEGVVLNVAGGDVSWAHIRAWAPGVTERDGKFYMYFCAEQKIGVAVADRAIGPFKDAIGKPLVKAGDPPGLKGQQIDPCPFIDDAVNGAERQAYLYWGNSALYVRKLNKDMISFDGDLQRITPKISSGTPPPGRFNEGVFVFIRKGLYYFMWSENDARSVDYRVAYGTSDSPLGPIHVPENRIVLSKSGLVVGTGHHSVINIPGTDRWYIIYHRHAVPGGNGFIRETCLSKMEFADDGSILKVDVTKPAFGAGDAGERVQILK